MNNAFGDLFTDWFANNKDRIERDTYRQNLIASLGANPPMTEAQPIASQIQPFVIQPGQNPFLGAAQRAGFHDFPSPSSSNLEIPTGLTPPTQSRSLPNTRGGQAFSQQLSQASALRGGKNG